MSDIRFDMGEGVNLSEYRTALQETIKDILKRIEVSDEGIKWVIIEEEKFKEMDKLAPDKLFPISSFIKEEYKYGCCDIKTNTIWISTEAIHTAPLPVERLFPQRVKNQLAEVILDELAHIMTKRNHGDEKYEEALATYRKKYYG